MASKIDPTVIKDNQLVAKQDMRNQLTIAASEISALQRQTSQIRKMQNDDALWNSV